jgi:hypothetical protein
MEDVPREEQIARCVFCRMRTDFSYLGLPLCGICRDQVYDFLWASGVQAMVALVGGLSGFFFVMEEVLLFVVLVLVRHRLKPPWERAAPAG